MGNRSGSSKIVNLLRHVFVLVMVLVTISLAGFGFLLLSKLLDKFESTPPPIGELLGG